VISVGLRETWGLTPDGIAAYLNVVPGVAGNYSVSVVQEICGWLQSDNDRVVACIALCLRGWYRRDRVCIFWSDKGISVANSNRPMWSATGIVLPLRSRTDWGPRVWPGWWRPRQLAMLSKRAGAVVLS